MTPRIPTARGPVRRNLVLTAAAAVLAVPLVTVPAQAAHTEPQPRTGFETNNGARWTGQPEIPLVDLVR